MSRKTLLDETIAKAEEAEDWQLAKWLRTIRDGESAIVSFMNENDQLKAENSKLRELVQDAWGDGHPDVSCENCEMMDECHAAMEEARKSGNGRWNTRCLFECRIEDRMRELGIEVD